MNETRIKPYETDEQITYVIDGDTMARVTSKWSHGRLEILNIEEYYNKKIRVI